MDKKTYKLLLVDDDEFLIDIYTTKFKEAGHTIDVAKDAEGALLKVRENAYDALLMDIVMPGMDGFSLLEEIKKKHIGESAALIVLSNQGQDEDIAKAQTLGADGYIIKASTVPSGVLETVIGIIEKKKSN